MSVKYMSFNTFPNFVKNKQGLILFKYAQFYVNYSVAGFDRNFNKDNLVITSRKHCDVIKQNTFVTF